MMTIQEVINYMNETCEKYGFEKVLVPVVENKRIRKTHGRVFYDWSVYESKYKATLIEFSVELLNTATEDYIKQVALHELAHYLLVVATGENHGHDAAFRKMCAKIKCTEDKACGTVKRDPNITNPQYKYTTTCSYCGKVTGEFLRAGKSVKQPELFHSKCCKAKIIVTQNY